MIRQILLVSLLTPIVASVREGSVHVSGVLLCNGQPYANERVQVFEKNYVLGDGKWAERMTDENGSFSMKAWGWDYLSVTPYLYIPNYCGSTMIDGKMCTTGGFEVNVPPVMISPTRAPQNTFDVGTLELNDNNNSEQLGLGYYIGMIFTVNKECRSDQ